VSYHTHACMRQRLRDPPSDAEFVSVSLSPARGSALEPSLAAPVDAAGRRCAGRRGVTGVAPTQRPCGHSCRHHTKLVIAAGSSTPWRSGGTNSSDEGRAGAGGSSGSRADNLFNEWAEGLDAIRSGIEGSTWVSDGSIAAPVPTPALPQAVPTPALLGGLTELLADPVVDSRRVRRVLSGWGGGDCCGSAEQPSPDSPTSRIAASAQQLSWLLSQVSLPPPRTAMATAGTQRPMEPQTEAVRALEPGLSFPLDTRATAAQTQTEPVDEVSCDAAAAEQPAAMVEAKAARGDVGGRCAAVQTQTEAVRALEPGLSFPLDTRATAAQTQTEPVDEVTCDAAAAEQPAAMVEAKAAWGNTGAAQSLGGRPVTSVCAPATLPRREAARSGARGGEEGDGGGRSRRCVERFICFYPD
jgi:hypothetical protein